MPNTVLKNRIRIARGNKANATDTLVPGAPFYDTSTKYLYIGKDSTTPVQDYTNQDIIKVYQADNATNSINSNISKYAIADISKSSYDSIKNDYEAGYITLPVAKQQVKQLFDNADKRFLICDSTSEKLYLSDNASGASSDSSFPSVPYSIQYEQLLVSGNFQPIRVDSTTVLAIPNVVAGDLIKIEVDWDTSNLGISSLTNKKIEYIYVRIPNDNNTCDVGISLIDGPYDGATGMFLPVLAHMNLSIYNKYLPNIYGDNVNIAMNEVNWIQVSKGADQKNGTYQCNIKGGSSGKRGIIKNIWKIIH